MLFCVTQPFFCASHRLNSFIRFIFERIKIYFAPTHLTDFELNLFFDFTVQDRDEEN